MQYLHKPCQQCRKPMNGGVYRLAHICPHCGYNHAEGKAGPQSRTTQTKATQTTTHGGGTPTAAVKLLNKPAEARLISEHLGELNTEGEVSVKLQPGMFKEGKFVGASNEVVKAAMDGAKKEALVQLRQKAAMLGANTVAEITIKNTMKGRDTEKANFVVKASGKALMLSEAQTVA